MLTRTGLVAALFLTACGGVAPTMPADDAAAVDDAQAMPDVSDAAAVAPDAEAAPEAGCWQCVAAGWVDTCHQLPSTDAESCLHCGLFCTSVHDASAD